MAFKAQVKFRGLVEFLVDTGRFSVHLIVKLWSELGFENMVLNFWSLRHCRELPSQCTVKRTKTKGCGPKQHLLRVVRTQKEPTLLKHCNKILMLPFQALLFLVPRPSWICSM